MKESGPAPNLVAAIPLLHVESVLAAEAYYCGVLGFALTQKDGPDPAAGDPLYATFNRDGAWLHVSSHAGDGPRGGIACIVARDVDALFAEFRAKGALIHLPPVDQTWGNRELYVRDPDGNTLRFLQFLR